MTVAAYPELVLRRGEDRRIRGGHPWIFSNEVDVARTPLVAFRPGDPVRVLDHAGKLLGSGYVNPGTLIAARLVDRGGRALDHGLLVERLATALSLRRRLYAEPWYRLVFGEGDDLPGLTVERFGDVVVAQATTAGMDRLRASITSALLEVLEPRVVVWKNDSGARTVEGLANSVEVVHGALDGPVAVREGGLDFAVDVIEGQKTGWFFDQRSNRDRLRPYASEARVLDVFSYLGGWGLRSAGFGAIAVDCVDASASAVAGVRTNALRNGMQDRVQAHQAEAFDFLRAARAERRRWDLVVLDPPAFVKRKKDFKEGALAYRRLAEAGMQVLEPGGFLVLCSCSHHMPREALLDALQSAARTLDRRLQLLENLSQPPDHPVHPAIPESEYLKGFILRVLPAG